MVPVIIAARPELQPLLRQQQSTETPARRRALGTLVAAQVALAIVLGIGAGLMLRSLWNLQHVDPGFDARNVLVFRLQTTSKYNSLSAGLPYFEQVVERVKGLPGVTGSGVDSALADDRLQLDSTSASRRGAAASGHDPADRDLAIRRLGLLRRDGHSPANRTLRSPCRTT